MQQRIPFFRFCVALLLVPAMAFSASSVGKVRQSIGDVKRQKENQKDWKDLRVGAKVYQTDFVRTGSEAVLGIDLPDGSMLNIGENTEVEMSNLFEDNGKGAYRTRLNIKKGYVDFNVKKQMEESSFEFKTGTATASIRGTSGFVGGEDGVFFASLATGKFDIQPQKGGPVMPVIAGETMFGSDSLVTMKLASSGDKRFVKKLTRIVKSSGKNVSAMMKAAQEADAAHQKELQENNFTLSTKSPVEVCNDGLTIDGSYTVSDPKATLVLKIGKSYTSENLIRVVDGKSHSFTQKIAINDANKTWNESQAEFVLKTSSVSDSKVIELKVNKTCSEVNQVQPSLKFLSYDSLNCQMQVSVGNMQDDAGILTMDIDGATSIEEAISKNEQKRIGLKPGSHTYSFSMKDQAENTVTLEKKLGCYPMKRFNVNVYGPAKEVLKIPPPPPSKDGESPIIKTLQFKIKSPENDPVFLYKVTIKQNGKVILQETLGQIQSLDYQVPVELKRDDRNHGAQNRFEIEVKHKSGFIAKAEKIFEVR